MTPRGVPVPGPGLSSPLVRPGQFRFPIPYSRRLPHPSRMPSFTEGAVGRSVARKDGMGKATGKALYADDLTFPGMLYGRTIRSTIPRGRVRAIRQNFDADGFIVVDCRDIPGKNVIVKCRDGRLAEVPVTGHAFFDPDNARQEL